VEGEATLPQLFVVAQDGPAFAGVQVLGRLEAEAAGLSPSAHFAPPPLGQMRLAGVFNYRNIVARGSG